jgi:hypothetical protein
MKEVSTGVFEYKVPTGFDEEGNLLYSPARRLAFSGGDKQSNNQTTHV